MNKETKFSAEKFQLKMDDTANPEQIDQPAVKHLLNFKSLKYEIRLKIVSIAFSTLRTGTES